MSQFFSRLSYSFGNEDWRTEQKALQINPKSNVLCITASGDRTLHLLLDNPQKIVSVDANPVQTHLLKLKLAAMQKLDPQACLAFLGAKEGKDRYATLKSIRGSLEEETAEYWDENSSLIKPGIIYQGVAEKWTRHGSWFLRFLRNREIQRLYAIESLDEQRSYLKNQWNHTLWRNAFRYFVNSWFSRFLINDPGLYANIDSHLNPGLYLYERMMNCLNRQLARENPLISLILRGTVNPEALPPYLTAEGIQTIRPHLNKVQMHTANVITYLESVPENSFDRFSLSDIASYMDLPDFLRLLKAMFRAAKPQARFCMRQFMSRYKIPEGLKPYFQTEPELERDLEQHDGAFVYHFTVGRVIKD